LDTEGSELDILMGAENTLSRTLAVELEVAFYEFHEGRPLFSDVDQYLRGLGFSLYDLDTYRHTRSALPALDVPYTCPSTYGQLLWGDALYIKDPIRKARNLPLNTVMTPPELLKLTCLFDLFKQHDSAIELLEKIITQGIMPGLQSALDLLIPQTFDRYLSLDKYREIYTVIPEPC
jgi:hypothetical protein